MGEFFTIRWQDGEVVMLDQRLLPTREVYRRYRDYRAVARAITRMVIRGAPAIGVAAAMGIALGARQLQRITDPAAFERLCQQFAATRPTAVNLFWAIERMRHAYAQVRACGRRAICDRLTQEALAIYEEDVAANRRMGQYGATLIPPGATVLTHCNAGALATAGYGTALGVIRAAWEQGKQIAVIVPETRPFLQGARLTAWELVKEGIPATLVTDSMVGYFMQKGKIDCVVVGTDRTAANGDVANKIGTYTTAVLAARHRVPFYVAAPTSSIDLLCPTGAQIPIEERAAREVTHILRQQIAPAGVRVANPAFDVTPHELVSAIITEEGIARAPFAQSLPLLVQKGKNNRQRREMAVTEQAERTDG
ncbi:MAG: S-methyl-5-thioribose-1-phosphate isomerase [Candidatus Binatia bacterium]|nr:S-methyl-5-thioribose-1-phosphate isomerase [Candidatus Binatia bacterium]